MNDIRKCASEVANLLSPIHEYLDHHRVRTSGEARRNLCMLLELVDAVHHTATVMAGGEHHEWCGYCNESHFHSPSGKCWKCGRVPHVVTEEA